jgi:very-short-patch-repair endonuclease
MSLKKPFIEILKQKLTYGNTRSILLNCIPGRLTTRLAINDLDIVSKEFSSQFIDNLTTKNEFTQKFNIAFDGVEDEELKKKIARISKRITSIKYDHDDYEKEHGIETFGFGFPVLVRKSSSDPTKYIAAPVFIWKLNIKQSFNQSREWVLSRSAESEVRLNEVLASFLESEEHIKIPQIPEEMIEDGLLDKAEIATFITQILSQLKGDNTIAFDWGKFDCFPEKMNISDAVNKTARVIWSGVFGIYKSQKQSMIKEMELLLKEYEQYDEAKDEEVAKWEQNHSPMHTDPSQNAVLRSLSVNRNLVIQGPPGTGKSQTLTAIVSSALSNGKKILIVCEKRTALEVLQNNLEKLLPALAGSIGLIEDVSRDRNNIVEKVRSRTAGYLSRMHTLQNLVKEDIERFETKAKTVEAQYSELRRPIWRNHKWADLVSKWMSIDKSNTSSNELYQLQKLFDDQNISETEYYDLVHLIEEGAVLFEKAKNKIDFFDNWLSAANKSNSINSRELIFNLKTQCADLDKINIALKNAIDEYAKYNIEKSKIDLETALKHLEDIIAISNRAKENGINPYKISIATKIKALFISKYREIVKQLDIFQSKIGFIDNVWSVQFQSSFDKYDLERAFEYAKNNKQTASSIILNKALSLNLNSPQKLPNFDLNTIAVQIQKLKSTLNSIALQISIGNNDCEKISFHDASPFISEVLTKTREFISNGDYLEDYREWKKYATKLTDNERKWVDFLCAFETQKWKSNLENAWIFNKLIRGDQSNRFPTDDANLQILKDLGLEIQKQQKEVIKYNLDKLYSDGYEKIKKKGLQINQLYNLRGSKGGKRNSLRSIINTDFTAFTDFFPVLMLNPITCSSLLPLQRNIFDIVIFDEASQLRIEDTYSSLIRGKQVVVSGDSQQMPPSSYFESSREILDDEEEVDDELIDQDSQEQILNDASRDMAVKESLLQFAIDFGYKETYLDMHYRSRHPDLIEFSNVSFYNSRLIPMPEKEKETPIRYIQVNGLYDKRQNETECQEILKILRNEISDSLSVGIATFNLEQRNLILRTIGNERSIDTNFQRKMVALEEKGFFVKNLENIQGDERDVIIISTTFGVRKDGRFLSNFGPITQKNGHRLLNVIITRAKNRVYIVTSIPEGKIADYNAKLNITRKVDGGIGLLAYLDYAKAVSTSNDISKKSILDYIKSKVTLGTQNISDNNAGLSESPFEEEVYNWLAEVIEPKRITQQYPCGGFRIDMVVEPINKSGGLKLAIECDGAAYHTDELTWHHDMYRQEQLEQCGFRFYRIWSTNWWRKPNDEFQKLLKEIEKLS